MTENQVRILDGNTFVVSDERGDTEASLTDPTGLFSFDTRFPMGADGRWSEAHAVVGRPAVLRDALFLVPGTGTVYVTAKLSVIRHRSVGNGFHEELIILNHDDKPAELIVSGSKPA